MVKGQVIAGDFSKIVMRIKANSTVELGELLVIEENNEKIILQVYDLVYASQISQQNLEMISGMNLEDEDYDLIEKDQRNYQLALLKPILNIAKTTKTCKKLPPFFAKLREIKKEDLAFVNENNASLFLGKIRSGSRELDFNINLPCEDVLSHHVLIPASTGKGKSNLVKVMLWNLLKDNYAGLLVLDPHDEYYGRNSLGLKDHPCNEKVSYYTPANPPTNAQTLKINLKKLKPQHFMGSLSLSDPQRQAFYAYYKKFGKEWIENLLEEKFIEGAKFNEDTLAVVKRKLISLLNLELDNGKISCNGIFDLTAGENTISDICKELEQGKIVIVDTSYFSGSLEILIGSMVTNEIFFRYKNYKKNGFLNEKPPISIVLEEAPRVLGKKVLEQGSNIFDTLAREGRKFKVGLMAITQLPSEIPKNILANMNTKIILGIEMNSERQAVIESSPQDLSKDNRNIASLDKGEALITSTFTKFAIPVKIPLFEHYAKSTLVKEKIEFLGINLG
jgi:uncharacterized protein